MKVAYLVASLNLLCTALHAFGQDAPKPVATVTAKSYQAIAEATSKIAGMFSPTSDKAIDEFFAKRLGIGDLEAIDRRRPWHFAVWYEQIGGSPVVALYIPVKEYVTFIDGIDDEGFLSELKATGRLASHGRFASARILPSDAADSDEAKQIITDWDPPQQIDDALLHVSLTPNNTVRRSLLASMNMMKKSVSAAIGQTEAQKELPYDPQAVVGILGLYLEAFEGVVNGLQGVRLTVNLDSTALTFDEHVTPIEGSALQELLSPSPGDLGPALPHLGTDAPVTGAIRMGAQKPMMDWLGRLMELNFKMQSPSIDPEVQKQLFSMMEEMMPMVFGGSVWLDNGISFAGAYSFPETPASTAYEKIRDFFDSQAKAFTGEDQMYSSVNLDTDHRQVQGISIDRYTFVLNLDSPYLKMPGQKEMLDQIWPEGRFVIEYAVNDNKMFIASPDRMETLLTSQQSAIDFEVSPQTVGVGRINPIIMLKTALTANPMLPDQIKKRFSQLDPTETAVTLKVEVEEDTALHSQLVVPLKLFEAIGPTSQDQ